MNGTSLLWRKPRTALCSPWQCLGGILLVALRILSYKYTRTLTWCKDGLFATVRALCDGSQTVSSDGSLVAQS
jgi:hypothetical protein